MDNELNEIMKDFEQLQERLRKYLENQGIPQLDPSPYDPWNPLPLPNSQPQTVENNKCSKCGIELHQTMGYVCGHPDCPTGLGTPWCGLHGEDHRTTITNSTEGKPIC